MTSEQLSRYKEGVAAQVALTDSEIVNASDYWAWLNSWKDYAKFGGDRPPVKPPHP